MKSRDIADKLIDKANQCADRLNNQAHEIERLQRTAAVERAKYKGEIEELKTQIKQIESNYENCLQSQGGLRFEDWDGSEEQRERVALSNHGDYMFCLTELGTPSLEKFETYPQQSSEQILCHAPKQEEWYVGKKTRTDEVPDGVWFGIHLDKISHRYINQKSTLQKYIFGKGIINIQEECESEHFPELCTIVENPEDKEKQRKKAEIEKRIKALEMEERQLKEDVNKNHAEIELLKDARKNMTNEADRLRKKLESKKQELAEMGGER